MKRAVVLTVVAIALGLPAGALATVFYKGPVGSGAGNAGLELHVKFHNGAPRKVKRVSYFNVPVPGCVPISDQFNVTWRVSKRKRKFRASEQRHGDTVKFTGRFKRHDKRIAGTLRVRGPVPTCLDGDTGTVPYVAKKGG